jgi:threonine/homoserine/homoserine lactone efflux protein
MTYETALPLIAYAFATSITPGPNNFMLMASGANFGIARTLPHLLGVTLGFVLMTIVIGAGLVQILETYPIILQVMRGLCFVFLIYLAWRIATSAPPSDKQSAEAKPLSFLEAAAFQWVNPKAIAMALSTITAYAQQQTTMAIILAAILFGLINFPSCGAWIFLGQQLQRWLQQRWALRLFNISMALILVASMLPTIMELKV